MNATENRRPKTLGISGRIAKSFLTSEITPLLALTGLLLGLFAVLITPREEEPQINVTFANVFIPFPGASAREVESIVTTPAEQFISEIAGVENIYSASTPGMSALTVRFKVGEPRTEAIVRLYNAFYSNKDWFPANSGVGQPLIKPKGIDDVPIVAGTLWSQNPEITAADLLRIAHTIETELQRVPGTRDIETLGGPDRVLHVEFDPVKMAGYGVALSDIHNILSGANASASAGQLVQNNQVMLIQAGAFLSTEEDVANLVIGVNHSNADGSVSPVFLQDIAEISQSADQPTRYVSFGIGPAGQASSEKLKQGGRYPAVTISVSKKPGENAVEVANAVIHRFEQMRGIAFPDEIEATITRDYGATAQDKAQTLIRKLLFATLSVVILVFLTIGRREAIVVGSAVIVTLAITLFSSWAWGFTLNRVSLFALIFSIGILVDDAIVVVENIHRHMLMGGKKLKEAIPLAVDEVGGPTILATFTVIAALLPMAFVTGLMGPYMLPIPINASTGMLISLAVAFIFTPWLYLKLFAKESHKHQESEQSESNHQYSAKEQNQSKQQKLFSKLMMPFLTEKKGPRNRWFLLFSLVGLILLSVTLVGTGSVVLKMLPFDNKSEFQVLVDMPEGTPLEETYNVLQALADHLDTVPEVTHYQLYAGTSAPINFNGLVRQYYLRTEPHQGDIQVNLLDKHDRHRKSHDIASSIHKQLTEIGKRFGATLKMVEVPPGPPVLAPLVAEIYGLDYSRQQEVAKQVKQVFEQAENVVDVDDTSEAPQQKVIITVDRSRAARLGVSQESVVQAIHSALQGADMSYLHNPQAKTPIAIRVELAASAKTNLDLIQNIRVRSNTGKLVPISEVTQMRNTFRDQTIYHKDLLPVVYVTGDVSGGTDSPLYGLAAISAALDKTNIEGSPIKQFFMKTPNNPYEWSLKWDGEWDVTFKTFRDMGTAYAVGLILIYLLVVAQFGSYGVPLIIMAPIPLTMIGILPGHALLGQHFTAPSMIGMIALAGIIVRNSILLVDFIQLEVSSGKPLRQATIDAAVVRAKPIALTAAAAMMGGFFIIDDPIFGGLAVSLIFGLLVSTILTLLVIPVVYYHFQSKKN